ncbi:hypothetical protein Lal_00005902 [Lupinus albus]|nr:hypothetical protein Lal_00005902 [Lupinus albus]
MGLRCIFAINNAALLKLTWEMLSYTQDWDTFFRKRFIRASRPSASYLNSSDWAAYKHSSQLVQAHLVKLYTSFCILPYLEAYAKL